MVLRSLLLIVCLGACEKASTSTSTQKPAEPAPAPAAPKQEAWSAGAENAQATPVTVAQLLSSPDAHKDKSVRVEGTVKSVCQHKGCWVEISDGDDALMVKSLDHGIAFPKDGVGRRMLVEGTFRIDVEESCGGHGSEDHHAAEENVPAHECPKPKLLVEVSRAQLKTDG
jgi:hypothetical protein